MPTEVGYGFLNPNLVTNTLASREVERVTFVSTVYRADRLMDSLLVRIANLSDRLAGSALENMGSQSGPVAEGPYGHLREVEMVSDRRASAMTFSSFAYARTYRHQVPGGDLPAHTAWGRHNTVSAGNEPEHSRLASKCLTTTTTCERLGAGSTTPASFSPIRLRVRDSSLRARCCRRVFSVNLSAPLRQTPFKLGNKPFQDFSERLHRHVSTPVQPAPHNFTQSGAANEYRSCLQLRQRTGGHGEPWQTRRH